jgi:hypothetical protein
MPAIVALLALPALLPLADPRFYQSHDGIDHLFRTLAFETSFRARDFLPRWIPEFAYGFGYPLFAVYSPLPYYIPALLALSGIPIVTALKMQMAFLCVASALGAYVALRVFTGREAAVAGAACYACAPYTLANVFVRFDLGETSTLPLTALSVAGMLHLARYLRNTDNEDTLPFIACIVLTAIPLALIPATHSLSMLTFLPTLACLSGYVLWHGGFAPRRPLTAIAGLCIVGLLTAGLAAWFVLPAIEWQSWIRLSTLQEDRNFLPKLLDLPLLVHALPSPGDGAWFGAHATWWFFSVPQTGLGELPASPSYISFVAAIFAMPLVLCRRSPRRHVVVALLIAAFITAIVMTRWSLPLWLALPRLTQLQFPWRTLGALTLTVSLLAGAFVEELPHRLHLPGAFLLTGGALVPTLLFAHPTYDDVRQAALMWPVQSRRELQGGFGTALPGLFLPRWVATDLPGKSPSRSSLDPRPTTLTVRSVQFGRDELALDYVATQPEPLTIAWLYIPAWTAWLDGRELAITPQETTGLQQVAVPAGEHHLHVALEPTSTEVLGTVLSLLAAVGLVVMWLFQEVITLDRWCGPRPERRRQGERAMTPRRIVAVLVLGLAITVALVDGAFGRARSAGGWIVPETAPNDASLSIVGWQLERSPDWGWPPVLHVALMSKRAVGVDEQIAVRLATPAGDQVIERRQAPRLGIYHTAGWPAGLLVDDHLLLPGPANLCPGRYQVDVGVVGDSPADEPVWQRLGSVDLTARDTFACSSVLAASKVLPNADVSGSVIAGAAPGTFPMIRPDSDITVALRLRTHTPTRDDDTVSVTLVDAVGQEMTKRLSAGHIDFIYTSLWRPGGTVDYQTTLHIPATARPGIYHLDAGLYASERSQFDTLAGAGESDPRRGLVELERVKIAGAPGASGQPIATFGETFGLSAIAITGAPNGSFAPGDELRVRFDWHAIQRPEGDFTVFFQLLDASGKLVAQTDGPPVAGRYPTGAWDAGETIVDQRTITLPRTLLPGRYQLISGWYALEDGHRLRVTPPQPNDAWPVSTIVVGPP